MAQEQLVEVVTTMIGLAHKNLLFIYDRGYPSLAFLNQHQELGGDFIFRLQRGMYKDLWSKVDQGERDFDFNIINKKTDQSHCARIVVINLPCGNLEVLATSIVRSVYLI